MATIRIADDPHPKDGFSRTKSQDDSGAGADESIYKTRSVARSDVVDAHDDIYNIRSLTRARSDRRGNGIFPTGREDDDPGLGKASDFKQKQVSTQHQANV
jgi:KUP system potassium uptake protein